MEAIIQNQKIYRRRSQTSLVIHTGRSLSGNGPSVRRQFTGPSDFGTALISRIRTADKFTIFAGAGILLLLGCFPLFLLPETVSFSPGSGTSPGRLELPVDEAIPALLTSWVEGFDHEVVDGEELVFQSAPSVLSSVTFSRYTVRSGDSIASISKKFSVNAGTLISFNRLENARSLKIGASLRVPSMNGLSYTVRSGDSLSGIAHKYQITLNAILDANNMVSEIITPGMELFIPGAAMRSIDVRKVLGELFRKPVSGRLTSFFGMRNDPISGLRRFHYGIDLAAPTGTPVNAAMAGSVAMIGTHPTYGKYVILQHEDGYQTWYAHLNVIRIKSGQKVSDGQLLGEVGSTGYSTGPHLHFSIYKRGNALDPLKYLY